MEPFHNDNLSKIFQIHSKISDRLITRESSTVEFKANFHLGRELDRYGRTMAAFANANGGYLIFGVADNPRTLVGMTNKKFVDLEPHILTAHLNKKFSPELAWELHIHYIGSKEFGIIYTYESAEKPVIARSDGGNTFQEGDIFYRYRARTERIKYSELRNIIEQQKQKVHNVWFKHLSRISKIGADNAAIFDTNSGTVTGKSGQFIIDKKLLPKLSFIKEGEFKEVTGKPAIRIVGDAKVLAAGEISAERTKIETRVIHSSDIIIAFLKQQKVLKPIDYIIEICHGSTAYLPIYFFIKQANLKLDDAVEKVKCAEHCNLGVKSRLIDRLTLNDPRIHYTIPETDTPLTQKKWDLRKSILEKKLRKDIEQYDLRQTLYVIQTITKREIDIDYLFPILLYWYENLWDQIKQISKTEFRKAVCHLDYVLYRDKADKGGRKR